MSIKKFRIIVFSLLTAFVLAFCGCYDLGDFEDDSDYYASFGNIGLIAQSKSKSDYSLEDYFYNEKSINDYAGNIVAADEYIYLIVPIERDMTIEEVALSLCAESEDMLEYSLFLTEVLPANIRAYDDPFYQQATDEDGNLLYDANGNPIYKQKTDENGNPVVDDNGNPVYVEIEYDDPLAEDALYTDSISLTANSWREITISQWKVNGESTKSLEVKSGDYLLVRFDNNTGAGKDSGKKKMLFQTTNLLIRAIGVL